MNSAIAPAVVAAIVAIFFGSFSAALVTHLLTSYRADKEYRLQKTEELFNALHGWNKHQRYYYHQYQLIAGGYVDWETGVKAATAESVAMFPYYATVSIIANVYFPCLVPSIEGLDKFHTEVNVVIDRFRESVQKVAPSYETEFERADKRSRDLRREIDEKVFELARAVRRGSVLTWLRDFQS
jgi:hypothetical protein